MNAHLNELDAQLDELERIEREVMKAMEPVSALLRKARARVRAVRREQNELTVVSSGCED